MKELRNKIVFITGAGSGIGRETALAFARAGARVIASDLRIEAAAETQRLIEAAAGNAAHYAVDVTDAGAMQQLAAQVEREHGVVDVLVNNAGIGAAGRFLDTTLATWRKVFDINLMGVVHGCHAFLPAMVARGAGGHVVNLASLAAYVAAADMPVYCSSKFAVLGFSESLRADMARHGIGVTAICPGVINTNIIKGTIMEGDMGKAGVRDKVDSFYEKRNYTPAQVAANIVDAVRRNQGVRPVSPESWVMYYLKRLSPALVTKMAGTEAPFLK
jgi:NAD(P)-dependent dehydrogenase (short-subunit alcohol dehydrogenase family)